MTEPNSISMDTERRFRASRLYGKGCFTTISLRNGNPLLWEKHWRRLVNDARELDIDLSGHTETTTLSALETAISKGVFEVRRVRISFYDERLGSIWPDETETILKTSLDIITGERRSIASQYRTTISPYPINSRSPLAGVKSCNYLEPIMSLDEAKAREFHEAIRVNERGFVTSVCMANVFWVKSGELFTPGLTTGCLAGTTREFVMENTDCREVEVGIEVLADADAIFLTSAGIGVVRVAEFEGKRLEKVDHPILHLLPY